MLAPPRHRHARRDPPERAAGVPVTPDALWGAGTPARSSAAPPAVLGWSRDDPETAARAMEDLERTRKLAAAPAAPIELLLALGRFELLVLRRRGCARRLFARAEAKAATPFQTAAVQAALAMLTGSGELARTALSVLRALPCSRVLVEPAADVAAALERGTDSAALLGIGELLSGTLLDHEAAVEPLARCAALRAAAGTLDGSELFLLGTAQSKLGRLAAARESLEMCVAVRGSCSRPSTGESSSTSMSTGESESDEVIDESGESESDEVIDESGESESDEVIDESDDDDWTPDDDDHHHHHHHTAHDHGSELVALGSVLVESGDLDAARPLLVRAIALGRKHDGLKALGKLLRQTGELAAARTALERCLAIGDAADARLTLALVLSELGLVEQSRLACVGCALSAEAGTVLSAREFYVLGSMLLETGDFQFACATLQHSATLFSLASDPAAASDASAVLRRAEALAAAEAADPEGGGGLLALGAALLEARELGMARAALERCVGIREAGDCVDGDELLKLGELHLRAGNPAAACDALEACIELREARGALTGDAHFLLHKAVLEPEEALEALERCVEIRRGLGTLASDGVEVKQLERMQVSV